jgi:hypothetical protein
MLSDIGHYLGNVPLTAWIIAVAVVLALAFIGWGLVVLGRMTGTADEDPLSEEELRWILDPQFDGSTTL